MTKIEDQSRLVIALKAFTGKLPPPYVNETEFFLVSLQNMAEYLADLQKEALKAGCDNFIRKLDAGTVTSKTIDEFKAVLGRLISSADLKIISASMVGSKSLIKQRLSALEPISLVAEWKKTPRGDPEAERQTHGTYARLHFAALAARVEAAPTEASANAALARAREEVAEYCCLYCIPMNAEATFKPVSLACVDAALAACYDLFKKIRKALGRSL